jgi:hypothetical protein
MANYKAIMNKDKETKCTQTKPKCDSKKVIIINNDNNNLLYS